MFLRGATSAKMNDIDQLTEDELSKLSKSNLLALIRNDKVRRNSNPEVDTAESLTLSSFEALLDKKLKELSTIFATRVETIEKEVDHLRSELTEIKDNLLKSNKFLQTEAVSKKNSEQKANSSLELLIFGVGEVKEPSTEKRFEQLKSQVSECLIALEASAESDLTDVFRIGKYQEGKNRPILLRLTSIWSKRKILAHYHKQIKEGIRMNFVLKENIPDSPAFREARRKARCLNEKEQNLARETGHPVLTSYSAKPDGSILCFEKVNDKWVRSSKNPSLQ